MGPFLRPPMRCAVLAVLLLALVSLAGCSGGSGGDRDGDGVPDGAEAKGYDILVDLMDHRERRHVSSDAGKTDTDGDGLDDFYEWSRGTDPGDPDTDHDGLTDCQEVLHSDRKECEDPAFHDWDGGTGTNPTNADSDPGPVQYKNTIGYTGPDGQPMHVKQGDGLSDGQEVLGFSMQGPDGVRYDNVTLDPRDTDTDGDGLEDGYEVLVFGSLPWKKNTDGDACDDGLDAYPEVAERYAIGLRTFTLLQRDDGDGAAQLRMGVWMAGNRSSMGPVEVREGQETDLFVSSPPPSAPVTCEASPVDPWLRVRMTVHDVEGDRYEPLDVFSVTADEAGVPFDGPGDITFWWQVRDGRFAWEWRGEPFEGPVELEGSDGRLVLWPELITNQAA